MKLLNTIAPFVTGVATISLLFGCTTPDPEGRFEEFSEIKANEPIPEGNFCDARSQDIEGTYFVRIQHSISSKNHILMSLTVKENGGAYDLTFQPLKTDNKPDARAPVGEPIIVKDILLGGNGFMEVNLIGIEIDGEANSTTGSNILADISLDLAACDQEGFLCGNGSLNLIEPFEVPGTASLGAVKVDNIDTDTQAPTACDTDPE